MRRVLSLAIAGMFTLVLSAQAQAQTMTLTATLSGSQEAPAVAATGAGGVATVVFNLAADTVTWTIDVFNLPTGVTAGHIHVGGVGVAGPVVINFTVNATQSNDFRISGTASASDLVARPAQGINSWDDLEQAAATGHLYANIHTTANPGGEIRGQLTVRQ